MCSISGFLSLNNSLVSKDSLDMMLQLLHHRGPDSQGKKYFQTAGFAHNRLSLLDLSNLGNQPFEDDTYVLVYHGDVDNY